MGECDTEGLSLNTQEKVTREGSRYQRNVNEINEIEEIEEFEELLKSCPSLVFHISGATKDICRAHRELRRLLKFYELRILWN